MGKSDYSRIGNTSQSLGLEDVIVGYRSSKPSALSQKQSQIMVSSGLLYSCEVINIMVVRRKVQVTSASEGVCVLTPHITD